MITYFQVEEDSALPRGLCRDCSESALAALNFRQACTQSLDQWTQAIAFLSSIVHPQKDDKAFYIFYTSEEKSIIGDQSVRARNKEIALKRLNGKFQDEEEFEEVKEDRIRKVRKSKQAVKSAWRCPDCEKVFPHPQYLNAHLKNTLKRACGECGIVLNKSKLAQHLSDVHGRLVYTCGVCHQVFDEAESLETHFITHKEGAHHCKVCGSGFSTERALITHNYYHSFFYCNHCGRCFDNRKCFFHHENQCQLFESNNKKRTPSLTEFVCDHCGNSYTKKPSLRTHIIQKHLNVLPYVCETCGKRTSTIAHLRSHEKVHLMERKTFQCYCGAKMRTALGYQLHMRIHSGEKPYKCSECGDKFLSASRRLDHVKRRHRSAKDMPHGCNECPARFVRPFELKRHYMTVHSNLAMPPHLTAQKTY